MHARCADIVLAVRVAQWAAVPVAGTRGVVLPAPVAGAARAVSANGLRISGLAAVAVDVQRFAQRGVSVARRTRHAGSASDEEQQTGLGHG